MTQGELEALTTEVESLYSQLEIRILNDIVERIRINGFTPATADWEITRLEQLGMSEESIKKWVQSALDATDDELEHIFSDEVYKEYYGQAPLYKAAGLDMIPYEQNVPLQQLTESLRTQLHNQFGTLSGSMGLALRGEDGRITYSPLMQYYRGTLDDAIMEIASGATSYDTVLRRTVTQLTNSGLRWIDYDSGVHNRVDVAVRRAVMTGWRQVQSHINEQTAAQLGTDTYEVSYHVGARPSHQPWEGRVWTYDQLVSECGLGDVTGLCGANCYPDYAPFVKGASARTYTDEELDEMIEEENTPKEYGGKQYTTYEALQEQRRQERSIRATRQQVKLLETGGASKEELILKRAKYQGQMQGYKAFSDRMGLPMQYGRIRQDGLSGRFSPTKKEVSVLQNAAGKDIIEVEKVTLTGKPNSITQITGKRGGIDRNYYGADGRQTKQISNHNHGNARNHPYGLNGEHAHDYIYTEGGKVKRTTREMTTKEREENADILWQQEKS